MRGAIPPRSTQPSKLLVQADVSNIADPPMCLRNRIQTCPLDHLVTTLPHCCHLPLACVWCTGVEIAPLPVLQAS